MGGIQLFTHVAMPDTFSYHVELYTADLTCAEIAAKHIDQAAINACKACKNYGTIWTCPPFDFDRAAYWNNYQNFRFVCYKILFDDPSQTADLSGDEVDKRKFTSLGNAKSAIAERLLEAQDSTPGSEALFPGTCWKCGGNCQRAQGKPCINPRYQRKSIEALGGNNMTLARCCFGLEFQWALPGKLPDYFMLTGGLLF